MTLSFSENYFKMWKLCCDQENATGSNFKTGHFSYYMRNVIWRLNKGVGG